MILISPKNPNNERTLSLAYCTAPHLKKDADEIGAFNSRDALRDLIVGKNVQFQVLYTIPNTKREYGIVVLNDGRRLPEEMVKEGWLKLREDAGRKEDSEEALKQLDHLRLAMMTKVSGHLISVASTFNMTWATRRPFWRRTKGRHSMV